jgi:hypothetical protein
VKNLAMVTQGRSLRSTHVERSGATFWHVHHALDSTCAGTGVLHSGGLQRGSSDIACATASPSNCSNPAIPPESNTIPCTSTRDNMGILRQGVQQRL